MINKLYCKKAAKKKKGNKRNKSMAVRNASPAGGCYPYFQKNNIT